MLYAFVNMCTTLSLSKTETTDILNAVVLGHSSKGDLQDKLDTWDISKKTGESQRYTINSLLPFYLKFFWQSTKLIVSIHLVVIAITFKQECLAELGHIHGRSTTCSPSLPTVNTFYNLELPVRQ